MSSNVSNLDKLTEKIYQEGVEKAETEAASIREKAEKEAEELLQNAREEAEKTRKNAQREAEQLQRSMESDIVLKGRRLMQDIKTEITHLLSLKIISKPVKEAFSDKEFVKKLIMEMAEYWKSKDDLVLTVSDNLKEKMGEGFQKDLQDHLPNLKINFSNTLQDGMRISRKEDSFEITFGEKEFEELFREYLEEYTVQHLFKK